MSLCAACGSDAGDVARFCPACGATVVRASGSGDPLIGRIVAGKFRVEALLGEGGMGMVYKATQVNLDKTVVLKVLRPSLISDERTVQRFQREARAASRLNHPNSIAVIDFGQSPEDGSMYIAMEYCPGHDLHHILTHEWPIDEPRIVRIVSQVLAALAEAHAHGVVHRDLKPENIMVEQRRGEADFVKVLDFGIAKITDTTGEEGQALTRAGFVCGTPEYMSPEQARGDTVDARSDLYAVGVILYQLVTGMLPFDSESAVGFATAHLTQPVPPIKTRNPKARCSPQLERLIMRALSKHADKRPQTAEAFRDELIRPVTGSRAPIVLERDIDRTAVNEPVWNDRTPAEPNRNAEVAEEETRLRANSAPRRPRASLPPEPAPAPPQAMSGTATSTATAPNTAPETTGMGNGQRMVLAASGLGLMAAFAFFVHEFFLSKPAAATVEPVTTVQVTREPVPVATHPAKVDPPQPATAPSKPSAPEIPLTALSGDPAKAQALIERARSEVRQGKMKDALALAQQAYGNDPNNLTVVRSYAEIAAFLAGSDDAQKSLAIDLYQKLSARPDLSDHDRKVAAMQLKRLSSMP